MTRKDYVAIARALKLSRHTPDGSEADFAQQERTARLVADELFADNPHRFDRERFLQACGVQS